MVMRVVCIDANACPVWGRLDLVKGRIYTVIGEYMGAGEIMSYLLVESKSPHPNEMYRKSRFRPVKETKTDISVFKFVPEMEDA